MAPITIIPWKEFLSFSRKDEKVPVSSFLKIVRDYIFVSLT